MPHTDIPDEPQRGGLEEVRSAARVKPSQVVATPVEPVYFHDCPALGKNARVVKAYFGSKDGSVIYGQQYKCPFCSYSIGELEPVADLRLDNPDTKEQA